MKFRHLKTALAVLHNWQVDDEDVCASHDELNIGGPDPDNLSTEEKSMLDEAGWFWNEDEGGWTHYT